MGRFWSFLFLLFAHFANAQEGQNPFDLEHRLNEKKEQSSNQGIKPQDNQVAPPASNNSKAKNPFDLDRSTESQVQQTPSTQPDLPENPFDLNTPPEESNDLKAAPPLKQAKKEEASGFVFWAILLLTVFLALEITLFKSLIIKVYRAFTNDNILKLLHREQRDIIAFPYLLLYIFFFVSFGIFTFLTFYSFIIERHLILLGRF